MKIGSLHLQNPIMPASGTFGEYMADTIDLNRLGAIVTKTITEDIREGNPPPRVAEFVDASLFSIGIPSKGVNQYVETQVPFYRGYTPPLIASISADTVEDFGRLAGLISVPGVAAIEANISCPNLKKDGLAFGMDAQATRAVIQTIRAASPLDIWAKLTPQTSDIAAVAKAAEDAGANALVVANALLGMAIDTDTFLPRVGNLTGGLTGPATRPILLRMAHQCAQAVSIPVIGCGGISTARDAIEYFLAGASAVQVGTANFVSPHAMIRMIEDLKQFCLERGIKQIGELVGAMRQHEPLHFKGVNVF